MNTIPSRMMQNAVCIMITTLILVSPAVAQVTTGAPPPQLLTIDDAVKIALERSPEVALSQSRNKTDASRVESAFGAFLPQIVLTGGYTRVLTSSNSLSSLVSETGGGSDNTYSASAVASYSVFDGFSRSAAYKGAQANYSATGETLNQVRQDITARTRMAFINVLRAEQITMVRRTDLESLNEQLKRQQGLVQGGVAIGMSVYQIEADIANAELAIEQSRTDATVARHTLNLLMNYDPVARINLSSEGLAASIDSGQIAETRSKFGSMNEMLTRQQAQRPDLRAAQFRIESADAAIAVSKSDNWPSVKANLSYTWTKTDILNNSGMNLDLTLQYVLFDGFQRRSRVQVAESEKLSTEIDAQRLLLSARSELEQALARLDGAERQLRAADKAVYAARQNRFAADERFKAGRGTYTDYLLANNQYLSAQINQVNAVFNYRAAVYEIRYQLGE